VSTAAPIVEDFVSASEARTRLGGAPTLWKRLLRRPDSLICLLFLLGLTIVAIVAPIAMPWVNHEQAGNLLAIRQGPSWKHLLGTDSLGRDVLERLLVGTTPTMVGVGEMLFFSFVFGVPAGLVAGYFGGRVDKSTMWLADILFALPGLIIVLVVLTVFPFSLLASMVTLGVLGAPFLIRIVRSVAIVVREELYIAAARVSGLSRFYIISRHVAARVAGPIIVQMSLLAGGAILAEAAFSYLGLLGAPPAASWGGMLNDGLQVLELQPWLIWPPGVMITLAVLAFGALGDALRDETAETWSAPPPRRVRRRPRAATTSVNDAGDAVASTAAAAPVAAVDAEARVAANSELPLLLVDGLCAGFTTPSGIVTVVEDATFEIRPGQAVGLVGESGCGKTVTAMSILGLLPGNGEITGGRILFAGQDLTAMSDRDLHKLRGSEIGLISQEPMISLNPVLRVGWQLSHLLRIHHGMSHRAAKRRTIDLLERVRLPDPEAVARRYAHELSGGMAQRVAIARALAGEPKLLVADEPTTALDVTVQAEILDLLRDLQRDHAMAVLLVTHDWGVVADLCERAVVMYAGQIVERGDVKSIFSEPLHPYTAALLASNPHNVGPNTTILPTIPGSVPVPGAWPTGCHFHPRCKFATAACRERPVELERPSPGRETRCIHHDQLADGRLVVPVGPDRGD
jgi:peptide/nickel transport system permease protein